jgi:hypothetical protein
VAVAGRSGGSKRVTGKSKAGVSKDYGKDYGKDYKGGKGDSFRSSSARSGGGGKAPSYPGKPCWRCESLDHLARDCKEPYVVPGKKKH